MQSMSMQPMRKAVSGKQGFTLIEMAVVVLIIGILTAAFAQVYAQRVAFLRANETARDVRDAVSAISAFRTLNGRYPCPASLTLTPDSPDYGRETDCANENLTAGQCGPNGTLPEGVCAQLSQRSVQFSSGGAVLNQPVRVRIGALPFRQLNIPESKAVDGYGNRITYVVTERLAVSDRFDVSAGGLSIVDQSNQSTVIPASSGHFMIFSHGENGNGAFSKDGVLRDCGAGATNGEGTNCTVTCATAADGTPSCTVNNIALYRAAPRNEGGANGNFDDIVDYFSEDQIPVWQLSRTDPTNIHQRPPGNIGINAPGDFEVAQRAFVGGGLNARNDTATGVTEGRVMSGEVCGADGILCFPVTKLSGTIDAAAENDRSLHCTVPGEFMVGVRNGQAVCEPRQVRCDPGQYMLGINPDGTLMCSDSICPSQQFGICGVSRWVTSATNGVERTITEGTRSETYRCENGNWQLAGETGVCACTPTVVRTNDNVSCGTGYTGRTTSTVTMTCPDGTLQTTVNRGPCTCVALADQTRNRACPAGFTGRIYEARSWTCTRANQGRWSAWRETRNTCVCDPTPERRTVSCPNGLTGGVVQEATRSCPAGTLSSWREISRNCSCKAVTETRRINCPVGYDGSITQERRVNCPSGTWTAWVEAANGNNCRETPAKICKLTKSSQSQPSQFGIGSPAGSTCACGSSSTNCYVKHGSNDFTNYKSCNCD